MLMQYCRKVAKEYDLWISTYYEMDLGRRGIQYVHSPAVAVGVVKGLDAFLDESQRSVLKGIYRKSVARVFNLSADNIRQNLTLVNSKWTGQLIKRAYGIDPYVVYPPVSTQFPYIPWDAREEGFVCIGRIAPSKRIDTIIQILKRVREAGWDVHLHIVGEIWDSGYGRKIEKLQRENSDWVFLEGRLTREQLADLVARHKYGIHGMRNEHFGIAVAEMVKAGNIVFVPNDGGQVEIVNDQRLTYGSEEEAIEKIVGVLSSQQDQVDICKCLEIRTQLFSTARFMEQIREIVGRELGR
ncbi:MAG TPA: glycosyltransferase [Deltaproteobacteria bacterium]|nr:glycosyltransferase [Deltaproteobacteria bacterium]